MAKLSRDSGIPPKAGKIQSFNSFYSLRIDPELSRMGQNKAGPPEPKSKSNVLAFVICALGLFWILSLGIGSYSFAQEEKFFEIRAKKFVYTPNIIKVNKGDLVRVRLISEDVHHGFFLDGYAIKTSAYPGQEGSLKFRADKNGRFSFRCSVTCGEFHPYMVGYLIVEPNTRYLAYIAIVLLIGALSLGRIFLSKDKGANALAN